MSENFNSMYWIGKRVEHEELSEALRAAARRKRRKARSGENEPRYRVGAGLVSAPDNPHYGKLK